jgi:hypothetical protein
MRLAWIIYPRHTECLVRSVGFAKLMRCCGLEAEVVIGIRKLMPRKFHAWVQLDGASVSLDGKDPKRYVTIYILPGGSAKSEYAG